MKKLKYLSTAFILMLTISSCTTQKPLYNWKGYDNAVYAYTKNADESSIEDLTKIYDKLIEKPAGTRKTPPPGVCADYGYILIKKGDIAKGKELLIKETVLYPESKPFIDRIIKRIEQ
ncbi:DUF4810 domain-containing protein [Mangrovibacterium marinum]|uniref:DUF4810 domain-containing protein n=1 Tax=Mangrovibacterium marinum TaxID=1639118 RepID=A0A2T5C1Y3_9BACT|nr:DUF4810 domain-containing protein [Mangrovibacterium marinum]PTN08694.1 hypothetical protein C8N47_10749 [Mangrovibacterium marinum]